jgi:hypothetical protein
VLSKACELFILELGYSGFTFAKNNRRKTIKEKDLKNVLKSFQRYDFLLDMIDDRVRDLYRKLFDGFLEQAINLVL